MEENVCVNDHVNGYDQYQLDNIDLASTLLELDAEDLTEIHRMVDEWEFNFGSIESSDAEELLRLVQLENPIAQFACSRPATTNELHDRLPSYYTALASSQSSPWIQQSTQQVYNKLPAYITDVAAPVDESANQPGKRKLNLAEYRTRREKQLQEKQEEPEVKVEVKVEPEEVVKEKKASSSSSSEEDYKSRSKRKENESRLRSSRSPTRSYSSGSRSSSRRHRSSSTSSYSSRSRSRSPRRQRRRRRSERSPSWRRRRRTPTPPRYRGYNNDRWRERERQRQIEERRVIYVGKLAEGTTRADLRKRFEVFGPVVDISLHFRERGDNYGFVTFAYKVDAYEAVEHGNDDHHLPKYDLSFGGRRAFCKETYADLDAADEDGRSKANDVDFDTLLRAVKNQLRNKPAS